MTIGVVGAGGTGSPTVEKLLRLGVGTVISIDDDVITRSTPTAPPHGTADLGMHKVDAMARLNDAIGLGSTVIALPINVGDPAAEDALATCDVIFGCTDSHYSRIVLNRLAYYHLVPVIDLGVLITPNTATGIVSSINGRVSVIAGRTLPALPQAHRHEPSPRREHGFRAAARPCRRGLPRRHRRAGPAVVDLHDHDVVAGCDHAPSPALRARRQPPHRTLHPAPDLQDPHDHRQAPSWVQHLQRRDTMGPRLHDPRLGLA